MTHTSRHLMFILGAMCPRLFFECQNQKCIQSSWRCDGVDNCGDNSDEVNCTYNGRPITLTLTL